MVLVYTILNFMAVSALEEQIDIKTGINPFV